MQPDGSVSGVRTGSGVLIGVSGVRTGSGVLIGVGMGVEVLVGVGMGVGVLIGVGTGVGVLIRLGLSSFMNTDIAIPPPINKITDNNKNKKGLFFLLELDCRPTYKVLFTEFTGRGFGILLA